MNLLKVTMSKVTNSKTTKYTFRCLLTINV